MDRKWSRFYSTFIILISICLLVSVTICLILVFQPLLSKNIPEYDTTTLFQECGIPARTLLVSPSCFTCPSDAYFAKWPPHSVYLCLVVSLVPSVSEWKPPRGQPLCSATALAQDSHSYHQTIRSGFSRVSVSRPKKSYEVYKARI